MDKKLCGMFCWMFLPSALRASFPTWPVMSRAPGALCTFDLILFNALCSDNNHWGIKPSLCLLLSWLVKCKSTLSWSGCSNFRSVLIISLTISECVKFQLLRLHSQRNQHSPLCSWDTTRCHSNSSVNCIYSYSWISLASAGGTDAREEKESCPGLEESLETILLYPCK